MCVCSVSLCCCYCLLCQQYDYNLQSLWGASLIALLHYYPVVNGNTCDSSLPYVCLQCYSLACYSALVTDGEGKHSLKVMKQIEYSTPIFYSAKSISIKCWGIDAIELFVINTTTLKLSKYWTYPVVISIQQRLPILTVKELIVPETENMSELCAKRTLFRILQVLDSTYCSRNLQTSGCTSSVRKQLPCNGRELALVMVSQ